MRTRAKTSCFLDSAFGFRQLQFSSCIINLFKLHVGTIVNERQKLYEQKAVLLLLHALFVKLSNVNICCVIMIPVWVEKWKRHKKVTNSARVHRVYQTKNVRHPFWRRENPSTALTGRKTRAVGSCWRLTSSVVKVLKRARLSIKYGSQFIVATVKYWYLHHVLTAVVILASESPSYSPKLSNKRQDILKFHDGNEFPNHQPINSPSVSCTMLTSRHNYHRGFLRRHAPMSTAIHAIS